MSTVATLFPEAPIAPRLPSQLRLNPDNVRNGLVQLVFTLVELRHGSEHG